MSVVMLFLMLFFVVKVVIQIAIYMGPILDLCGHPYGECNRVPYGLAQVNKINSRSRGGARIS